MQNAGPQRAGVLVLALADCGSPTHNATAAHLGFCFGESSASELFARVIPYRSLGCTCLPPEISYNFFRSRVRFEPGTCSSRSFGRGGSFVMGDAHRHHQCHRADRRDRLGLCQQQHGGLGRHSGADQPGAHRAAARLERARAGQRRAAQAGGAGQEVDLRRTTSSVSRTARSSSRSSGICARNTT